MFGGMDSPDALQAHRRIRNSYSGRSASCHLLFIKLFSCRVSYNGGGAEEVG